MARRVLSRGPELLARYRSAPCAFVPNPTDAAGWTLASNPGPRATRVAVASRSPGPLAPALLQFGFEELQTLFALSESGFLFLDDFLRRLVGESCLVQEIA